MIFSNQSKALIELTQAQRDEERKSQARKLKEMEEASNQALNSQRDGSESSGSSRRDKNFKFKNLFNNKGGKSESRKRDIKGIS
eukprot:CAMPEP_0170564578 /NCGR_PEP_ID=MMETSP0211-20121228/73679_1 /TAXON_ID=311385 /ORGANISM="Pseudokeronopsis sp., Strain OXSARD2" /LENGTH=83 /DNA_ID=CAMNT_0010884229 /DNA_START=188 /DNA_END=439 /DNA_ORIENTATION=+